MQSRTNLQRSKNLRASEVASGSFSGPEGWFFARSRIICLLNIKGNTIGVSSPSLGFGDQVVGTRNALQTVTLFNTSALALNISSVAVTGTNATDFRSKYCGLQRVLLQPL